MKNKLVVLVGLMGLYCGVSLAAPIPIGNVSAYKITHPAASQVAVSTMTPILSSSTFMLIESTASGVGVLGQVTFVNDGTTSKWPAIATSTVRSGQVLILNSTTTASSVKIETGTVTAVIGSSLYYVISSSMPAMQFIFNDTLKQWFAVGKQ